MATDNSFTIASAFVHNILAGARDKGHDIDTVLRQCNINPQILALPQSRVTFEQMSQLTQYLIDLLDDEQFGLTNRPIRKNAFRLACLAAIHSETIGDFIAVYNEFFRVSDSCLSYQLSIQNDQAIYRINAESGTTIKNCYVIESQLLVIHRLLCWLSNCRLPIQQACFDYSAPDHAAEYRYLFYGAPLSFAAPYNAIVLSRSDLKLQNVRDYHQLDRFLCRASFNIVSHVVNNYDLPSQVRHWISRQITNHHHCPRMEEAAGHFETHPQTFRRQLGRSQTSFTELKTNTRRDIAINLIQNDGLSIEAIAFQLDFADTSAFIRSFKNWTGLTPRAYRNLNNSPSS